MGRITICERDGKITAVSLRQVPDAGDEQETPLIRRTYTQLAEYLKGDRRTFDLPLAFEGTAFQRRVWQALCSIPYGQTRTYKQIAEAIGNPKGVRAIGMANNRNPLMIVVPCHRVIGSNGKMVGYAAGIDKKEFLLRLEGGLL